MQRHSATALKKLTRTLEQADSVCSFKPGQR
jgi:hypothetical protein